jgi:NAD(P)H-hydrate epimerase
MLTCAEMKALEERAFADGVSAEGLMDGAGWLIAQTVRQFLPQPGVCTVHFGKGHNGGDALEAAHLLAIDGWQVFQQSAFTPESWAPLTRQKHEQFVETQRRLEAAAIPLRRQRAPGRPHIILDGLLGIGASGELRDPIRSACRAINSERMHSDARVFAIDLPTGLEGDTGAADADTVIADYTLTIGCAKVGLLADAATRFVGRLAVLRLPQLTARMEPGTLEQLATPATLAPLLPRRPFDMHKGQCGRVGIIAGSPGLTGAAVMCAEAALHAGAGLVTLYVPQAIRSEVVARIAPEVMVRAIGSCAEVLDARHDVLAAGPGLGRERDAEILQLIATAPQPMVIDADALNALAGSVELLAHAAGPRLLTPHPGEMQRLDPESASSSRQATVERFTTRFPATLLLKGARTIIGEHGHPLSYNTTGSPAMATGGMGDVLTGVCVALLAQGLASYDAARLGAWLCGRAAELALLAGESEESLSATHVISQLGAAFRALRAGGW